MMTDEERATAALALLTAEDTRTPIDPLSNTSPHADIEDAYRVAMQVTELKVTGGRIVKVHKVGLTSKAMQDLAGSTEPDFGYLFAD